MEGKRKLVGRYRLYGIMTLHAELCLLLGGVTGISTCVDFRLLVYNSVWGAYNYTYLDEGVYFTNPEIL